METTLSLMDFVVGVQETALVLKHGRSDEVPDSEGELRRLLYKKTNEHLSDFEVRLNSKLVKSNHSYLVKIRRIYISDGYICRVSYVPPTAPDPRESPIREEDITATQLAAYFATDAYGKAPKGIKLIYHRLEKNLSNPDIEFSVVKDFELWDKEKCEKIIRERLLEIESALKLDDEKLPPCSESNRFATEENPYTKCYGVCRARNFCCQLRRHLREESDDLNSIIKG